MFGAVIPEDVEALCLDDDDAGRRPREVSAGDRRGEGIQQRLDRLRKHHPGRRGY